MEMSSEIKHCLKGCICFFAKRLQIYRSSASSLDGDDAFQPLDDCRPFGCPKMYLVNIFKATMTLWNGEAGVLALSFLWMSCIETI